MEKKVTIVTAYYKMDSKQSHETYVNWMSNMLCFIETPIVVFTDNENVHLIKKFRESKNIHIIVKPREKWYVSNKYSLELWEKHYQMDHEKNHSIDLYKVWNEKGIFLREAIEINPFGSSYFIWCDIGCFREINIMPFFIKWPSFKQLKYYSSDKCLLLKVDNISDDMNKIDENGLTPSFQHKKSIGGTIFGGSKEACLNWINAYYNTLDLYFTYNLFAGKDQNVMGTTLIKYPDLATVIFKYGDWFHFQYLLLE